MTSYTATYSPDDNKLRLYAISRLDAETYARVKAAGFIWAPKQELFVAPMWTPEREDILVELTGEIGDEDTSLVDRAEERAGRFDDYSDRRAADARAAERGVAAIADGIPFGQPILRGHHSEKHARKDQERIENGMRRTVKMWETAGYWRERAAGAVQAAKYKEIPGVRARRIKGIEADARKVEKTKAECQVWLGRWTDLRKLDNDKDAQILSARKYASYCRLTVVEASDGRTYGWSAYDVLQPDEKRHQACPARTVDDVIETAGAVYTRHIARCDRWLSHYANRLEYERLMLAESGGLITDRAEIEVGGQVLGGRGWFTVTRVNRGADGKIASVSCQGKRGFVVAIESVKDYRPATAETVAAAKEANSIPPLANFPGEGFVELTTEEWKKLPSDYRGTKIVPASEGVGRHRVRWASGIFIKPRDRLPGWTEAEGETARSNMVHRSYNLYISDAKRIDPPRPGASPNPAPLKVEPGPSPPPRIDREPDNFREEIKAAKAVLKAGVTVVAAPQLFPTPPDVARQMVALAQITSDHRVLEPSAGTGNLLRAIGDGPGKFAIEVNQELVRVLRLCGLPQLHVHHADFLECTAADTGGRFDRILMNPPFKDGADIRHIAHALQFLKPGGLLVAICANGPRQNAKLKPMAMTWEDLPDGTFASQGTGVRTVLLTIRQGGQT